MANNIVMVAGSKGGVGKSTTCINLARAFQLRELDVVVLDLDRENRTLMDYPRLFAMTRQSESDEETGEGDHALQADEHANVPLPTVQTLSENFSGDDILRLARGADLVFVDMPAGYGRDIGKVTQVASLAIIPTSVGAKQLPPAIEMARNVVNAAMRQGSTLQGRILLNGIDMRRDIIRQKVEELQQADLPLPLMRYLIPHRQGLDTAGEMGLTVFDYGAARDLRKIYRALADEIVEILGISGTPKQ